MRLLIVALALAVFVSPLHAPPVSAATDTNTYQPPLVRGVVLNWCKHNGGRECGQPAADLFCLEQGFQRAQAFTHDPRAGARGVQSVIFGDGMLCNGPQCQAFGAITCVRTVPDLPPPAPPPPPTPVPPQPAPPAPSPQPPPAAPTVPDRTEAPLPAPGPRIAAPPVPRLRPLVAVVGPGTRVPDDPPFLPPIVGMKFMATGAELFWCQTTGCDIADTSPTKVTPGSAASEQFKSDLTAIPWAEAGLWQVSDRPFPPFRGEETDLDFSGLLASGQVPGGEVTFLVDIDAAVANSPFSLLSTVYLRVIPLREPNGNALSARPTNTISVLYGADAPAPPDFTLIEEDEDYIYPDYDRRLGLFEARVTEFQLGDFFRRDRWGCVTIVGHDFEGMSSFVVNVQKELFPIGKEICPEVYRGEGTRVESLDDFLDWAVDSFDWIGGAYDALLELAADIVMDYTPFGLQCKAAAELVDEEDVLSFCKGVADAAVKAGATALGLPPTIPDYNELIDKGVDYAVELAADEISARTGVPCIGPCEDALRAGMAHFADELKRTSDTPGCVDPTEAHRYGSEPLCLPDTVIARPAPGAATVLPYVQIELTRTNEPLPEPFYGFHGDCTLDIHASVSKHFEARSWVGPVPGRMIDTPEQTVTGTLYRASKFPIDISMQPGETLTVATSLNASWYGFPWMVLEWNKYQTVGPNVGVYGNDWFTLYSQGTMDLVTNLGSEGGLSCLTDDSVASREIALPELR